MTMTRNDYELIAELLLESRKVVPNQATVDLLVERFADLFEKQNSRFVRERFYMATDHGPTLERRAAILKAVNDSYDKKEA